MFLRQMEYFTAVVEEGNFYLAGEKCHISQSAISQQIKKLEDEIGVKLLDRHNRSFTLTKAGEHFYQKSVVIMSDIEKLVRDTKRINSTTATLRLGYYTGYLGDELTSAIADFSQKQPSVSIEIVSGSHEQIFNALENKSVDLALNDQRRAFSDAYNNIVLAKSETYIELSKHNALSKLKEIDTEDLKNTPCIIVANENAKKEEREYFEKIVGLKCDYIFCESSQDSRLKITTGQGFMLVDIIGKQEFSDTSVCTIPLTRNNEKITKTYCAFWKKENTNDLITEFVNILQEKF